MTVHSKVLLGRDHHRSAADQGLWPLPGVFPAQMGPTPAEMRRVYLWVVLPVEEAAIRVGLRRGYNPHQGFYLSVLASSQESNKASPSATFCAGTWRPGVKQGKVPLSYGSTRPKSNPTITFSFRQEGQHKVGAG